MFKFRRFQSRILLFMLAPFLLVNAALIVAIDQESQRTARETIDMGLELTARSFTTALANRRTRLLEHLRASSGDFGFKSAVATRDKRTITSALENYSLRVSANVMIYIDIQQTIKAEVYLDEEQHVLGHFGQGDPTRRGEALPALIREVRETGAQETESIEFLNGIPYQLVVLPIRAPLPVGWLIIGFTIDQSFVEDLKHNTNSDVSILRGSELGDLSVFASTLPDELQAELINPWRAQMGDYGMSRTVVVGDHEYVMLAMELPNRAGNKIVAVLQRSLEEYLEPFFFLRRFTYTTFAFGILLFAIAGIVIARSVTRPVRELADMAKGVADGDYSQQLENRQEDEIGDLASSFNEMVQGLSERAKVLSLLGKVVSEEIATELLKDEIKLGGEEREVTVLFADIRDFTSLCEGRSPEGILDLVNRYLTRMTRVIESRSGVVDKYIGDAVMALFGAPILREEDARNAVACALEMCEELKQLNQEFVREGTTPLAVGIGVNTGLVVVGNMGSETRLNYTVIGDGVNLSSRLDGLTKVYGSAIIVSDATRELCPDCHFMELDRVQVKGKHEPLTIYEPLGFRGNISDARLSELEEYEGALAVYRLGEWADALNRFEALDRSNTDMKLYRLYVERIRDFMITPPEEGWDGVVKYEEK